jgi:hypothetical protein
MAPLGGTIEQDEAAFLFGLVESVRRPRHPLELLVAPAFSGFGDIHAVRNIGCKSSRDE